MSTAAHGWAAYKPLKGMAGTTGLEPAASAVTGQRSNQLNYVPTPKISHIAESRAECGFAGFAYSAAFALHAPDNGNSGMNRPQTAYKKSLRSRLSRKSSYHRVRGGGGVAFFLIDMP
jgi:hypothetical protein